MRPRGVVIPTAMFLVLVLFGLITAIHLSVQQNYLVTRHSHGQTRARYLAKAAVAAMVAVLNADASVERLHEGEQNAKIVRTGDESELKSWVVPADVPDVLHVVGVGTTRDGYAERTEAVVRRSSAQGVLFVRLKANDRAITFYYTDGSPTGPGAAWTIVNPIPIELTDANGRVVNLRESRDDTADFVGKVRSSAADQQGNLYAAVARDKGDRVVRYNIKTQAWELLPDIPAQAYDRNGQMEVAVSTPAELSMLASDGQNRLYTVRPRDGADTVLMLDQNPTDGSKPRWRPLPVVMISGETNEVMGAMQDLAADSRGRLYARIPGRAEDTIVQYVPTDDYASGVWRSLLSPRKYCAVDKRSGTLEDIYFEKQVPADLSYLSVSPQGDLYAVYTQDGLDTVFRRRSSASSGDADWKLLSPPERVYYDLDGSVQREEGLVQRLRQSAVDANGRLYVRWDRKSRNKKVDSVFLYASPREAVLPNKSSLRETPELSLLPALERKRWESNGVGSPPAPTLHIGDEDKVVREVPDLIGGGRPNESGAPVYELVGSY